MEARPPISSDEQELALAFDKLRIAVAWREVEHQRRWQQGIWLARGTLIALAISLVLMLLLAWKFDIGAFGALMKSRVSQNAPAIIHIGEQSVAGLTPVYMAEAAKTVPTFIASLSDDASMEAGRLTATLGPIVRGELPVDLTASDLALAKALQTKFKTVLGGADEDHPDGAHEVTPASIAVAKALRARQLLDAAKNPDNPLAGPFGVFHKMGESLNGLGPPDREIVSEGDASDEIGKAALDRALGHAPPPPPPPKAAIVVVAPPAPAKKGGK